MTILREYQRVAQVMHFCDYCFQDILPGSLYQGVVIIYDKNKLMVLKEHIDPPCPEDPFEEFENEMRAERPLKASKLERKTAPLKKAA